jgi:uncharacterized membrane protein
LALSEKTRNKIQELLTQGNQLLIGTYAGITFNLQKSMILTDNAEHIAEAEQMMVTDGLDLGDFTLEEVAVAS